MVFCAQKMDPTDDCRWISGISTFHWTPRSLHHFAPVTSTETLPHKQKHLVKKDMKKWASQMGQRRFLTFFSQALQAVWSCGGLPPVWTWKWCSAWPETPRRDRTSWWARSTLGLFVFFRCNKQQRTHNKTANHMSRPRLCYRKLGAIKKKTESKKHGMGLEHQSEITIQIHGMAMLLDLWILDLCMYYKLYICCGTRQIWCFFIHRR